MTFPSVPILFTFIVVVVQVQIGKSVLYREDVHCVHVYRRFDQPIPGIDCQPEQVCLSSCSSNSNLTCQPRFDEHAPECIEETCEIGFEKRCSSKGANCRTQLVELCGGEKVEEEDHHCKVVDAVDCKGDLLEEIGREVCEGVTDLQCHQCILSDDEDEDDDCHRVVKEHCSLAPAFVVPHEPIPGIPINPLKAPKFAPLSTRKIPQLQPPSFVELIKIPDHQNIEPILSPNCPGGICQFPDFCGPNHELCQRGRKRRQVALPLCAGDACELESQFGEEEPFGPMLHLGPPEHADPIPSLPANLPLSPTLIPNEPTNPSAETINEPTQSIPLNFQVPLQQTIPQTISTTQSGEPQNINGRLPIALPQPPPLTNQPLPPTLIPNDPTNPSVAQQPTTQNVPTQSIPLNFQVPLQQTIPQIISTTQSGAPQNINGRIPIALPQPPPFINQPLPPTLIPNDPTAPIPPLQQVPNQPNFQVPIQQAVSHVILQPGAQSLPIAFPTQAEFIPPIDSSPSPIFPNFLFTNAQLSPVPPDFLTQPQAVPVLNQQTPEGPPNPSFLAAFPPNGDLTPQSQAEIPNPGPPIVLSPRPEFIPPPHSGPPIVLSPRPSIETVHSITPVCDGACHDIEENVCRDAEVCKDVDEVVTETVLKSKCQVERVEKCEPCKKFYNECFIVEDEEVCEEKCQPCRVVFETLCQGFIPMTHFRPIAVNQDGTKNCKRVQKEICPPFRCKTTCKKVPTKKCVRKNNSACGDSGYTNCRTVNKEICKRVPVSVDKRVKKTFCEKKPECRREKRRVCRENAAVKKCPQMNEKICTLVKRERECRERVKKKPECRLGQCKKVEFERCRVKMPGCKERICDHHHHNHHNGENCRLIEEEICSHPICEEKPVRKCKPCPRKCSQHHTNNNNNNNKCQSRCFNVYSCPICSTNNNNNNDQQQRTSPSSSLEMGSPYDEDKLRHRSRGHEFPSKQKNYLDAKYLKSYKNSTAFFAVGGEKNREKVVFDRREEDGLSLHTYKPKHTHHSSEGAGGWEEKV